MAGLFFITVITASFICIGEGRPDSQVIPGGNCAATISALPPDPKTECCGVEIYSSKTLGGNETLIDKYPWLVLVEYIKQDSTKILCTGSLISGKYVLLPAHCVVGPALNIGIPKNVRLGEYDTRRAGPDCTTDGASHCTDGAITREIEEIVPHPQYKQQDKLRRNDIALIRLKEMAPYTDFIRPICLPSVDVTLNPPADFFIETAGWHSFGQGRRVNDVKLRETVTFKDKIACQAAYANPPRNIDLWEGQLCADVGQNKQCLAGPLMYENGQSHEIIGVVSFGATPCGVGDTPDVFTKVHYYLDWIRNTIKP